MYCYTICNVYVCKKEGTLKQYRYRNHDYKNVSVKFRRFVIIHSSQYLHTKPDL